LESQRHHLPFKSDFHVRFLLAAILNFGGLPSSTNVGQPQSVSVPSVKSTSGAIKKPLELFLYVAENRRYIGQQKIFDLFFHGRCPWFSRSLQVTENAIFSQKALKHLEIDPLGLGFDSILKFPRVAKIFETKIFQKTAVRGRLI